MMVVTYKIAGIVFRTESDIWLPFLLKKPFEQFRTDDIESNVCIRVHNISVDSLSLSPPEGEEKLRILCYTKGRPDRFKSPMLRSPKIRAKLRNCLESPNNMDIHLYQNWVVVHDFEQVQIDLYQYIENTPKLTKYPSEVYIFDSFPRMFATFLPLFSAILIHCSGVIRNEKAAIFLASGGGGKTTVAELSYNTPVLSDDLIVLRKDDGIVGAHATPLAEKTTGPCQAKIGGLFMLEKATHFELIPLKKPDMVQCLWGSHYNYTNLPTKYLKKRIFDLFYNLCYQASVYLMRFPKDYVDWDAIDDAMEAKIAN